MTGLPFRGFWRREDGNVGLIFSLSIIPVLALAGGVIDYVNVENERARLQSALDTGVLAAMKLEDPTADEVRDVVRDYLESNYRPGRKVTVDFDSMQIEISTPQNGARTVSANLVAHVNTTFWGLVGMNTADVRVRSEARLGLTGLEVVMVLDNTGSMRGSKISELREAASQLVNDLKDNADSYEELKVGLVPFTSMVNIGTDKCGESWLSDTCQRSDWEGMVGIRPYDYDVIDDGYATEPIPALRSRVWLEGRYGRWYTSGQWDYGTGLPTPMIDLRDLSDADEADELLDRIDSMYAAGWTYIPNGLAWGWRMLTADEPFTSALPKDEAASRNIRKVVVLMTDGANTCHRKSGDPDGYMQCGGVALNADGTSDEADSRLRALCENVKADGVGIISITFEVPDGSPIKDLMQGCSNMGYYDASSGELDDVFRDIARKLVKLHLSR